MAQKPLQEKKLPVLKGLGILKGIRDDPNFHRSPSVESFISDHDMDGANETDQKDGLLLASLRGFSVPPINTSQVVDNNFVDLTGEKSPAKMNSNSSEPHPVSQQASHQAPHQTPHQTPHETPRQTPHQTPHLTPHQTPLHAVSSKNTLKQPEDSQSEAIVKPAEKSKRKRAVKSAKDENGEDIPPVKKARKPRAKPTPQKPKAVNAEIIPEPQKGQAQAAYQAPVARMIESPLQFPLRAPVAKMSGSPQRAPVARMIESPQRVPVVKMLPDTVSNAEAVPAGKLASVSSETAAPASQAELVSAHVSMNEIIAPVSGHSSLILPSVETPSKAVGVSEQVRAQDFIPNFESGSVASISATSQVPGLVNPIERSKSAQAVQFDRQVIGSSFQQDDTPRAITPRISTFQRLESLQSPAQSQRFYPAINHPRDIDHPIDPRNLDQASLAFHRAHQWGVIDRQDQLLPREDTFKDVFQRRLSHFDGNFPRQFAVDHAARSAPNMSAPHESHVARLNAIAKGSSDQYAAYVAHGQVRRDAQFNFNLPFNGSRTIRRNASIPENPSVSGSPVFSDNRSFHGSHPGYGSPASQLNSAGHAITPFQTAQTSHAPGAPHLHLSLPSVNHSEIVRAVEFDPHIQTARQYYAFAESENTECRARYKAFILESLQDRTRSLELETAEIQATMNRVFKKEEEAS